MCERTTGLEAVSAVTPTGPPIPRAAGPRESGFVLHPRANPRFGRKRRGDPQPQGPSTSPLLDVEDWVVEVWVRDQVLVGYDKNRVPGPISRTACQAEDFMWKSTDDRRRVRRDTGPQSIPSEGE